MNSNETFSELMKKAAAELNLSKHAFGKADQSVELFSAVDVEGHIGKDSKFYLLDLSRTFPPESPKHTDHLHDIYPDGSCVKVNVTTESTEQSSKMPYLKNATVHKAYAHGDYYHLICEDGTIIEKCPAEKIIFKRLSIYCRSLR